ncbi:VOC family protein [Thalassotalea fusca]
MGSARNDRSICHASVGTNQLPQAKTFYQELLATLEIDMVCDYEHAAAFGKGYPEFWVQHPFNGEKATIGNGCHFGFVATSTDQVDAFYRKAIELGAKCNGKPGPRADYGEPYYGAFVLDLDGNRIEASFWDEVMAKSIYG